MTDNEIIKVLKNELECVKRQFGGMCDNKRDCGKCDLALSDGVVISAYEKVLDLINRQKAEIERLKKENEKQKAMLEAIDNEMLPLPFETDFDKAIKTAKSEAIKEFAERLKSRLANLSVQTKTHGRKTTPNYVDDIANQILHDVVPQEIDNLVKEMKRGCK